MNVLGKDGGNRVWMMRDDVIELWGSIPGLKPSIKVGRSSGMVSAGEAVTRDNE